MQSRNGKKRAARDPARQVLGMAISVLGMAVMLLMLSLALGAAHSAPLHTVGKGLRVAIPYVLVPGLALLAIYFAIRTKPDGSPPAKRVSTLFAGDSTAFSQIDSRADDSTQLPEEPVHRGLVPPATAWNAQVFREIEWRRFEAVCASLFAQAGFDARAQSHGADGGVDIWLHSANAEGPAAVVQCKHWLVKPVGVKELREFYGVMASHKLARGTFATSGTFTAEARDFARSNGISALDGLTLLALISRRTAQQQKELLAIAFEGEYWRPTCASCGIKMVERSTRKDAELFWGCANYPRCHTTLPVRRTA
jgi:restriction system protein